MKPERQTIRDPICGMELDPSHVRATREFAGERFSFCSNRCAEVFDRIHPTSTGIERGPDGG